MPKVYNMRGMPPSTAVYVGRPGPYGNPFRIEGKHGRLATVARYRVWIKEPEQAELRARMQRELRGKDLVCWCAPLPCHADVILEIANAPN